MRGEGGTWHEDQRIPILRDGVLKEIFWTYSYGPIEDATTVSGVGGVLVICADTTRRVQQQRRISSERDRLHQLFEQAPGFMCIMRGPDHVFEIANRAYTDLLGKPALLGLAVRDAIPEAIDQSFVALLDQVYATGRAYVGSSQRLLVSRGEGTLPDERYLDFVYAPLVDETGATTGIFCQGTDVTDRLIAERAISESEARFRNMADHAPVMMWVTDPAGALIYLNRLWYQMTGATPETALGAGWRHVVHPDDLARVDAAFRDANAAEADYRLEFRLRMADGRYRWVLNAASPRFAESGAYLGFVGSIIDIDDRREAEQRTQVSESRFRAAIGAIQGVLWTNNAAGEMTGEQQGWSALTGQSPAEYAGFGWSDAVHPDDAAATVVAWQDAVARRRIFAHEHRVRRFDGEWRMFSVRAVPILDPAGAIVEWVGIHTDISQQRAAETALQALNDALEQRVAGEVAERIRVEGVLRQTQKMDALGQLTGGIAHDFNNMLGVTSSAFSLLQRRLGSADPDINRLIEAGQGAVSNAAGLTQRLLAFARQQPLAPEIVNVNHLVSELRKLLLHSLGKGIACDCVLAPELWPTLVDPNQLENALLNLAVNARDAMPDGGRLLIETRNIGDAAALPADAAAGDHILICVTDTGIGMTEAVRTKVFEPFFTTKPVGVGTGLGLSQVYGFVKQSGGSIDITSAPGEGTRIDLFLPRADP
nr:PAS domain S-box protein [Polymorphobacter fuscus]